MEVFIINYEKQKGIIYKIEVYNAPVYIGKSFGTWRVNNNERKNEHFRYLKGGYHSVEELQKVFDVFGEDAINFIIIESYQSITREKLNEREIYFINKYNVYNDGYNKTIGGDTVTGMHHSDTTKKILSEKTTGDNNPFYGNTHDTLARSKISKANKNKTLSDNQLKGLEKGRNMVKTNEHRRKIGEANKGKHVSKETKKKLSESKKGKSFWTEEAKLKRRNKIRKLNDNQIIEIFVRSTLTSDTNNQLSKRFDIGQTFVSNIKNLKLNYFKEIIINNRMEVLNMAKQVIKFEKENCNPCRMVQNLLDDEGVNAKVIKAFDEPSKAAEYGIGSVPTTILLDEDGNEMHRIVGFKPDELSEMIDEYNK